MMLADRRELNGRVQRLNSLSLAWFVPFYGVTVKVTVVCAEALPLVAMTVIGNVPVGVPGLPLPNG